MFHERTSRCFSVIGYFIQLDCTLILYHRILVFILNESERLAMACFATDRVCSSTLFIRSFYTYIDMINRYKIPFGSTVDGSCLSVSFCTSTPYSFWLCESINRTWTSVALTINSKDNNLELWQPKVTEQQRQQSLSHLIQGVWFIDLFVFESLCKHNYVFFNH